MLKGLNKEMFAKFSPVEISSVQLDGGNRESLSDKHLRFVDLADAYDRQLAEGNVEAIKGVKEQTVVRDAAHTR